MRNITSIAVLSSFILSCVMPSQGYAQALPGTAFMPEPGAMVQASAAFVPAILKGMKVYPRDPLRFDFLIDTGNSALAADGLEKESSKLVRYFLAALTVPEKELWVNLSPYEGDRIIPERFGMTEMGRDLLAEDYILKQLTSSLMYPEKVLGAEVWKRIYALAAEKYGTTDIPLDTFNKVWIVPDEAVVYVNGNTAFIAKSHLKVMLDADYLAAQKNTPASAIVDGKEDARNISRQVIREIVLPELEREVNGGANFSALRQIYHAMVLATWFKRNLKKSLVGEVYAEKNKVAGIDLADKGAKEKIWGRYVEAFKKGVFNYIKEERDEVTQEIIPRKYFSGGFHDDPDVVREEQVPAERMNALDLAEMVGRQAVTAVKLKPVDHSQAEQMSDIPFDPGDFSMGAELKNILGKFFQKGARVGPEFTKDHYYRILDENARYYDMELRQDGFKLLQDLFEAYVRNGHRDVVRGDFGAFRSLSGLWPVIAAAGPADAFPVISRWIMDRYQVLAGDPQREKELADFTIDTTRFLHFVIAGEVGAEGYVNYDLSHRSMTHLLNSGKWNCQAISDMTVVVMALWGIKGVSVVDVVVNPDGQKYPVNGIGHVANLVRVGNMVAYLDQGGLPEYSKGRVKVIVDGKEKEMPVGSIAQYPGVEGLAVDRVYAFLKLKNELEAVKNKLSTVPGVTVEKEKLSIHLTNENYEAMIRPLEAVTASLLDLSSRVVGAHDPTLVINLDAGFKSHFEDIVILLNNQLEAARRASQDARSFKQNKKRYDDLLAKCVGLGLMSQENKAAPDGRRINVVVTVRNMPLFIRHVPGLLLEIDAISMGTLEPAIRNNFQTIRDLLSQGLQYAQSKDQELKHALAAKDLFYELLGKFQDWGLLTVHEDHYEYHILPETAAAFLSKREIVARELEKVSRGQPSDQTLKVRIKGLSDFMEQAFAKAEEFVHKNEAFAQLNAFIRKFNEGQRDPEAMGQLRVDIRRFVRSQPTGFLAKLELVQVIRKLYSSAGGTETLDMGQSTGDRVNDLGGIDLDPAKLHLQETGGKINFDATFNVVALDRLIEGFSPAILSVTPLKDPQTFFGASRQ